MTNRPSRVPDDPNPISKTGEGEADRQEHQSPARVLPPAAQRALAEAEQRRRAQLENAERAREIGGQEGPDPVRYGDWEKGGIASDF